jgi:nitrite reductase/ring-hydroxylating ferredoxin subunit
MELELRDPPVAQAFRAVESAPAARPRGGRRLVVCRSNEIPPGERRIVEDGGISIGVFNIDGQFHALKNVCPHQGAPLCRGTIGATHRPAGIHEFHPDLHGRILRCPWHGWEFDIFTGQALHDSHCRVASYPVEVDAAGSVIVLI